MVFYRGKKLIQTAGKTGGKNNSAVDGFYIDESDTDTRGVEYFIKKPADKKELFTELFAGLLLQEMISRKLIAARYNDSLICADLIQFEDGSYGLIQPKVSFKELFKIIGTGYSDGSDRDPLFEMMVGPSYYPTLTKQGPYFGLSTALMFSLLLGDHSVHSGNVVLFDTWDEDGKKFKQFGRIDWGASFRDFAHPENNTDNILEFFQYKKGWVNFKGYTQGYFDNYKNISGLFTAIADKSKELTHKMSLAKVPMEDIVRSALSKIPADLLDPETKATLAEYMDIPSFATATFGEDGDYQSVGETFSAVLSARLTKIGTLNEANNEATEDKYIEAQANPSSMYQSVLLSEPAPTKVTIDPFIALPNQCEQLFELVLREQSLDFTEINLEHLAKQFNNYVDILAHKAEVFNLWRHEPESKVNIFAKYGDASEPKAILGNAFVPQYRESTVLRRLFTIDPTTLGTMRFAPYETATLGYGSAIENQQSAWKKIEASLALGYGVINSLNQIQKAQKSSDSDVNNPQIIAEQQERLQTALASFTASQNSLDKYFQENALIGRDIPSAESAFFYPLSDDCLLAMNGEQLVTICLEELFSPNPSPLIARIIKNNTLWELMEKGFSKEKFGPRTDNPQAKFEKLQEWRSNFLDFSAQEKNVSLTLTLPELENHLAGLQASFDRLPLFLKADTEILKRLFDAKALCQEWQSSFQSYCSKEKVFLQSKSIAAHDDLKNAFLALPADLKLQYEEQLKNHQSEMSYLQNRELHRKQDQFIAAQATFNTLSKAYEELPLKMQLSYQDEFGQIQKAMADWQLHQHFLDRQRSYLAANIYEKPEIQALLIADHKKLPLNLQRQYQGVMAEYRLEILFLSQQVAYKQQTTIAEAQIVFPDLKKAFDQLPATQKATYKDEYQGIVLKNRDYSRLLRNGFLVNSDKIQLADAALSRLQTGRDDSERLYRAALTDKRLWNAIVTCKKEKLSAEVVYDLLAIKQFYKQRYAPENDYEYGEEYNQSLGRFYEKSLAIRLSDLPIKRQASKIVNTAHEEFTPRHGTERFIADVLMLISVLFGGLGLLIMAGRHLANKPVFFSSTDTDRENDLKTEWIRQDLSERAGSDEACLFNVPMAAATA